MAYKLTVKFNSNKYTESTLLISIRDIDYCSELEMKVIEINSKSSNKDVCNESNFKENNICVIPFEEFYETLYT